MWQQNQAAVSSYAVWLSKSGRITVGTQVDTEFIPAIKTLITHISTMTNSNNILATYVTAARRTNSQITTSRATDENATS